MRFSWLLYGLALLAGPACQSDTNLGLRSSSALAAEREARRTAKAGKPAQAARQYKAAARLARSEGDATRAAACLLSAGEAYLRARQDGAARLCLADAVGAWSRPTIARAESRTGLLRAHTGLGDLDFKQRRLPSARAQYETALEHASGRSRDGVLRRLALLAEHQGDAALARGFKSRILRANPGEQRRLEIAFGRSSTMQPTPPSIPNAPAASRMPPVLPRSTWGASYARSNQDPMGRVWRLTVHHTATPFDNTSRSTVAKHLRSLQNNHIKSKKWADIGYHLLIDGSGRVWQGRPLNVQGAHAGNPVLNQGNVGVALLGDFSRRPPNRDQARALVQTLQALRSQFGISTDRVYTHRDIRETYTECPGDALQSFVEAYRRAPRGGLAMVDEALARTVALVSLGSGEPSSPPIACRCCCWPGGPLEDGPDGARPESSPAVELASKAKVWPPPGDAPAPRSAPAPSDQLPPSALAAPPSDIRKSTASASSKV